MPKQKISTEYFVNKTKIAALYPKKQT